MPKKSINIDGNHTYNLLFFIIILLIGFILYTLNNNNNNNSFFILPQQTQHSNLGKTNSNCNDKFNNICNPPLKKNEYVDEMTENKSKYNDLVPINIETRGTNSEYQQTGILTQNKSGSTDNLILPLMGRRTLTGRDKWQYYSMSNTGHLNSKLPISINGKSCTSEYGCDDINNGDMVYVEGYNDLFKVTKYENNTLRYLPSI